MLTQTTPVARRIRRTAALVIGVAAAAAVAVTPAAQAAPAITVYQIPATGLAISGLVVPGPYFARVTATPTDRPGQITFAAPASPETCATTAGASLVSITYANLTTGHRGQVTVKPCDFNTPDPLRATAETGQGQILATIRVTGSAYKPNAGQPSLPGIGTFTAP